MGFRYRKSINLGGGFRINISKSGVGYSWGTKGYRITKTAKGTVRHTTSIPGTGFSYTEEFGKKKVPHSQPIVPPPDSNHYATENIVNNTATAMVSDGSGNMLALVKRALRINKLANISMLISFLFIAFPLGPIALFLSFLLKIYIKTFGRINLDYIIDDDQKEIVMQHMEPMFRVIDSSKVWRVVQSSQVINKKYEAGASSTVKRTSCKTTKKAPFPFKANTPAAVFKMGKERLVFLPDKLFIIQGSKIGALNYSDISIYAHTQRFIENEHIPKDAQVVDYTWKYVNKSGGPDMRFRNNPKYPVCLYGELELKSDTGLNTIILFSRGNLA